MKAHFLAAEQRAAVVQRAKTEPVAGADGFSEQFRLI